MNKAPQVGAIIVGVDFSKHSKAAVLQARAFAKKWDVPLTLVHGFEDPVVAEDRFRSIVRHMSNYYEKKMIRVYKVRGGEKVIAKCGRPYEMIINAGKGQRHPLIVVGAQGSMGRFEKFFLGNTAERVAQKSPYPVWIHRGGTLNASKKALLPCDLTTRATHALNFLKKNQLGKSKTELFHVVRYAVPILDLNTWRLANEEIQRENKIAVAKFKKLHPRLKVIETSGDVFGEIQTHAKTFDFIALTPRTAKGFFAGFGSVTSKIIPGSSKSVLIIP